MAKYAYILIVYILKVRTGKKKNTNSRTQCELVKIIGKISLLSLLPTYQETSTAPQEYLTETEGAFARMLTKL